MEALEGCEEFVKARSFEYVLYFVRCDMVTVSPNQITIIINKYTILRKWFQYFSLVET